MVVVALVEVKGQGYWQPYYSADHVRGKDWGLRSRAGKQELEPEVRFKEALGDTRLGGLARVESGSL